MSIMDYYTYKGYQVGQVFCQRYPRLCIAVGWGIISVPILAAIGLGCIIRAVYNLFTG